ncbi:unnamed protein product [Strongylus vulgaris]|uniref:Uncharacterized protein n=1 Tax=Strongylus vulgaris TaxID=40348 RepID=A0A3P7INJ6_STRVU|nr:unnamed protein product [Strongylus vulgaris]
MMRDSGLAVISDTTEWMYVNKPSEQILTSHSVGGNSSDGVLDGVRENDTSAVIQLNHVPSFGGVAVDGTVTGIHSTRFLKAVARDFVIRTMVILSAGLLVLCLLLAVCCLIWCNIRNGSDRNRYISKCMLNHLFIFLRGWWSCIIQILKIALYNALMA